MTHSFLPMLQRTVEARHSGKKASKSQGMCTLRYDIVSKKNNIYIYIYRKFREATFLGSDMRF